VASRLRSCPADLVEQARRAVGGAGENRLDLDIVAGDAAAELADLGLERANGFVGRDPFGLCGIALGTQPAQLVVGPDHLGGPAAHVVHEVIDVDR
jgi:hypothetical protein